MLMGATAGWSNRAFPIAFPFNTLIVYYIASVMVVFTIDRALADNGLPGLVLSLIIWTIVTLAFATLVYSKVGTGSKDHWRLVPAKRATKGVVDTTVADDR